MTEPSLAEQREAVRAEIHLQRDKLAQRLALLGGTPGGYPRSATMRLLMRRPELLGRLFTLVAGPRLGKPVSAALAVAQALLPDSVR